MNSKKYFHWRPSRRMRRVYPKVDRYYDKCEKVANGHHSMRPLEKRYNWLIKQEYRKGR